MKKVTPVLLAGGSGARLWPLSRKSCPKQFSLIINETSLFQQSAQRLTSSELIEFNDNITITNSDFRFMVAEQLHGIGIDPGAIILEPEGKNTAPAILAVSKYVLKKDKEAVLLVAPSDHVLQDKHAFHKAVLQAYESALKGKIVTFGITPSGPETGYGYLKFSSSELMEAVALDEYIEKPDEKRAKEMVESGNYFWNTGIFMFRASDMIKAFENHCPSLLEPVDQSISLGKTDLGFFRLEQESWAKCENISIDYAIMELAKNLTSVPLSTAWSDLGSWEAVWQQMGPDSQGVSKSSNAHSLNCENTLLRSENEDLEVVGIGLKDVVVIAMKDAILVANKSQSQLVKSVIAELRSKNIPQADEFPKDYRPWGWFETLVLRGRFQVKRIFVNPGAALSLQSHHHRSEHWIVVEGTAKVTIGEEEKLVSEGQSVFIPLAEKHRLQNPGKVPMMLIEVQTGTYLGEDDIVRYEDLYSRS